MRKYLQHSELPNLPPLADMLRNTSLTLINHNSAVGYPLPLHKNVIEFGGINVKSGGKLPKVRVINVLSFGKVGFPKLSTV